LSHGIPEKLLNELQLEPSLIVCMLRYSPYIVELTGLAAIVAVIAWARRVVEKRLGEEYF